MHKKRFSLMVVLSILLIGTFILGACAQATPTEEPTEEPMEAELGTADNPITWVLTPSQDTQAVLSGAEGLTQYIEDETGIVIEAFVATDYTAQVEAICSGEAEMAAINTFGYVRATERDCADVALVSSRFGSTSYSGQLLTRAGSGIESVEDFAGEVFCRPDPGSTSGWIIPSLNMLAVGIEPETDLAQIVDAGGHDGVVLALNDPNNDCTVGSSFEDARDTVADDYPDVYDNVIVISVSPPIPNDNISFSNEVPQETIDAIVDALLALNETEEGQEMFNELYSWAGIEEAEDSFYDGFRQQLEAAGMTIEELVSE